MHLHALFFLTCTVTMCSVVSERKDLNILGLLPINGNLFRGGNACLIGANMALRHVNARDDILPSYKLNLIYEDTKCAAGPAVNRLFEMLYKKPTKHMIFGPGCSTAAEVTAQASPDWNLTTLSWGAASPLLSDKATFPRFFRVVAPDSRRNYAAIALARLFNWKKLATLNVALDYFSATTDHLVNLVKDTDISIISEEIFSHDPLTRIQNLKKKDARIIIAGGYGSHGKQIVCADNLFPHLVDPDEQFGTHNKLPWASKAYQAGLYGPKIVWMFPGWFKDHWWESSYPDVPCTAEQMALVVEGSILPGFPFININIERGIANITATEYTELYRQEEGYEYITEYEYISPNCYDAIWSVALALKCHNKNLDEFEYSDVDIADTITTCTKAVSFLGVTGHVKFDSNGEPTKSITIKQIQNGQRVLVGVYWTDVEDWYFTWYNGGIKWRGGAPPRDSTLVTAIEERISKHSYIVFSCLASSGIVLAVLFCTFNVIHREKKIVKLSSPNINNVLLLGCVISYSSVYMESLERETVGLCKARTFTFVIGFSMAFGALFSKTWRVYRIFSNKKLLQLRIRDYQLIGVVLGLLGVLCFVLVAWEIVDPVFIQIRYLEREIYLIGNDAEVHPYIRLCTSKYYVYFSWTIYIMEGALLSFGAFLSFETRRVKIDALNDSRLIGMCLYNVVVLSAVGLTLNLALEDKVALLYGINSGILLIGTTGTMLVVFVPKIMAVYCPHRIETDKDQTLDGSRLGTTGGSGSRKVAPPGDTTSSSLKISIPTNVNGSD